MLAWLPERSTKSGSWASSTRMPKVQGTGARALREKTRIRACTQKKWSRLRGVHGESWLARERNAVARRHPRYRSDIENLGGVLTRSSREHRRFDSTGQRKCFRGDRQPAERGECTCSGRASAGARTKEAGRLPTLIGLLGARGLPQVEVASHDANGIVNVEAKDLATGKEQKITISGGRLSRGRGRPAGEDAQSTPGPMRRARAHDASQSGRSLAYQAEKTSRRKGRECRWAKLSKVEDAIAESSKAVPRRRPGVYQTSDGRHDQRSSHARWRWLYKS